jgi:hypothetical protein
VTSEDHLREESPKPDEAMIAELCAKRGVGCLVKLSLIGET